MSDTAEAKPIQHHKTALEKIAPIAEGSLAALLSLCWIALHVRFFLNAGAMWRDEVNSVNLCNSPRISDILNNLQYDSFPLLWHLILRFWIRSGIGATDSGIRLLGLVAGLGILATLWLNARRFKHSTPVAALALLGFTSAVLCYGDSIRGYGLGMLFALLTLGMMWDVATRPNAIRIGITLLVSLVAVQVLFYNSVVLFAICCGAAAVAFRRKKYSRILLIGGIGFISALSMVPYHVLTARSASFRVMLYHEPSFSWLMAKFQEAVGYDTGNPLAASNHNDQLWELAAFAALYVALLAALDYRGIKPTELDSEEPRKQLRAFRKDVLIFHLTILFVGVIGYWAFLHSLSYLMQPWYYLALLALVAACVDGLVGSLPTPLVRTCLCLGAVYFCYVTASPDWYDAGLRKTNVDVVARGLAKIEHPGDVAIIAPWFYAITFDRYCHGSAARIPIPPVDFLVYHKYDLMIPFMRDPSCMEPVLRQIAQALQSGHSVYLVGDFALPNLDQRPITLQPAPDPIAGWQDGAYYFAWEQQIDWFITRHATRFGLVQVPFYGISYFERPRLYAVKGWVNSPPAPAQNP